MHPCPRPHLPEQGFGPWQALGRLLAAHGREPVRTAETLGCGDPQGELVAALAPYGLLARWTRLQAAELRSLELPTLALCPGGGYVLLTRRRRGSLTALGPGGAQEVAIRGLPAGTYLDLAPALPPGSLWQRIGRLVLARRRMLAPVLAAAVLAQALGLLAPQLTRVMVDRVFPQGAHSLFLLVLAASTCLGIYRAWVGWLQGRFELFLETRLGFLVEQGMFAHLLRLPYVWLSGKTTGDLLQGFFGLRMAREFLTGQALSSGFGILAGLGYLALMFRTLPGAALWVAGSTLVSLPVTILVGRRVAGLQAQAIDTQVKERSFLVEILSGVAVIKASGAERRATATWLAMAGRRRALELAGQRFSLGATTILGGLQMLLTQILTLWGGHQVLRGQLSLGELLAFTMMAGSFQQAFAQAASLYLQVIMMKPQLAKAQEILEVRPAAQEDGQDTADPAGTVLVQDLAFRYRPDAPWVFQDLHLTIAAGEKVVLRGPSGCGKSTLLKLVARLYGPERGRIRFGREGSGKAPPEIAYLPQFVQLFNGSILENLRLFSGGAGREALMAAARATGLADLVATLPMGYETLVSPGGGNFSGGQRQLIALTAVVASARKVLLLDEAMANLDPVARKRLYGSTLFQGRTVLLASHEDAQDAAGPEHHGFRGIQLR